MGRWGGGERNWVDSPDYFQITKFPEFTRFLRTIKLTT